MKENNEVNIKTCISNSKVKKNGKMKSFESLG